MAAAGLVQVAAMLTGWEGLLVKQLKLVAYQRQECARTEQHPAQPLRHPLCVLPHAVDKIRCSHWAKVMRAAANAPVSFQCCCFCRSSQPHPDEGCCHAVRTGGQRYNCSGGRAFYSNSCLGCVLAKVATSTRRLCAGDSSEPRVAPPPPQPLLPPAPLLPPSSGDDWRVRAARTRQHRPTGNSGVEATESKPAATEAHQHRADSSRWSSTELSTESGRIGGRASNTSHASISCKAGPGSAARNRTSSASESSKRQVSSSVFNVLAAFSKRRQGLSTPALPASPVASSAADFAPPRQTNSGATERSSGSANAWSSNTRSMRLASSTSLSFAVNALSPPADRFSQPERPMHPGLGPSYDMQPGSCAPAASLPALFSSNGLVRDMSLSKRSAPTPAVSDHDGSEDGNGINRARPFVTLPGCNLVQSGSTPEAMYEHPPHGRCITDATAGPTRRPLGSGVQPPHCVAAEASDRSVTHKISSIDLALRDNPHDLSSAALRVRLPT